jgi:hypothetical protein
MDDQYEYVLRTDRIILQWPGAAPNITALQMWTEMFGRPRTVTVVPDGSEVTLWLDPAIDGATMVAATRECVRLHVNSVLARYPAYASFTHPVFGQLLQALSAKGIPSAALHFAEFLSSVCASGVDTDAMWFGNPQHVAHALRIEAEQPGTFDIATFNGRPVAVHIALKIGARAQPPSLL